MPDDGARNGTGLGNDEELGHVNDACKESGLGMVCQLYDLQ